MFAQQAPQRASVLSVVLVVGAIAAGVMYVKYPNWFKETLGHDVTPGGEEMRPILLAEKQEQARSLATSMRKLRMEWKSLDERCRRLDPQLRHVVSSPEAQKDGYLELWDRAVGKFDDKQGLGIAWKRFEIVERQVGRARAALSSPDANPAQWEEVLAAAQMAQSDMEEVYQRRQAAYSEVTTKFVRRK